MRPLQGRLAAAAGCNAFALSAALERLADLRRSMRSMAHAAEAAAAQVSRRIPHPCVWAGVPETVFRRFLLDHSSTHAGGTSGESP